MLSGLIGALLAKRLDPFEAAALGALAHVLAGRRAAERVGPDHVMAGDVIEALPCGLTLRLKSPFCKVAPVAEQVSEIMDTDPVTVAPETSVEDVVAALREHELPGLPVVDSEGTVWGIVTEADLVLPDERRRPAHPALHQPLRGHGLPRAAEPLRGPPAQGVRRQRRRHDDPRCRHGRVRTPACARPRG